MSNRIITYKLWRKISFRFGTASRRDLEIVRERAWSVFFFLKRFIAQTVQYVYSEYKDKLQNCSCNQFE